MGAPLHCYTCADGGKFWKFGVRQSWNHIVVSWLRLQTPTDCIPHLYWMHKKCFSTLICCGWAYGCTLTLLYLCRWGPNFENLGSGRAVTTLLCHGWGFKPLLTASHIHIRCIKSVLVPLYAVDGHMGAPLHCYTCADGGQILENWGMTEPEWRCGVIVEAATPHWLHPTIILDA